MLVGSGAARERAGALRDPRLPALCAAPPCLVPLEQIALAAAPCRLSGRAVARGGAGDDVCCGRGECHRLY